MISGGQRFQSTVAEHVPHSSRGTNILMSKLTTVRTLLRLFFKVSLMNRYIGDPGIHASAGFDSPGPCSAKKSGSSAFAKSCKKGVSRLGYMGSMECQKTEAYKGQHFQTVLQGGPIGFKD